MLILTTSGLTKSAETVKHSLSISMIIFAKICISDDYRGFIPLFVHTAEFFDEDLPARLYTQKRALAFTKALLKKVPKALLYLWLNAVPSAQAERGGLTATHFFTLRIYTKKKSLSI
jgi:hypothetical protein